MQNQTRQQLFLALIQHLDQEGFPAILIDRSFTTCLIKLSNTSYAGLVRLHLLDQRLTIYGMGKSQSSWALAYPQLLPELLHWLRQHPWHNKAHLSLS